MFFGNSHIPVFAVDLSLTEDLLTKSGTERFRENIEKRRYCTMKHVKTLNANTLKDTMKKGGCGECQTSCQSACKTSCTVGNQSCENSAR